MLSTLSNELNDLLPAQQRVEEPFASTAKKAELLTETIAYIKRLQVSLVEQEAIINDERGRNKSLQELIETREVSPLSQDLFLMHCLITS